MGLPDQRWQEKMVSEFEGRLIKKITFEQTGKRLKKERKKEPYRSVRRQAVQYTFNLNLKEAERDVGESFFE